MPSFLRSPTSPCDIRAVRSGGACPPPQLLLGLVQSQFQFNLLSTNKIISYRKQQQIPDWASSRSYNGKIDQDLDVSLCRIHASALVYMPPSLGVGVRTLAWLACCCW